MTKRDAINEAVRRWGKTGDACSVKRKGKKLYRVGWVALGLFWNVEGEGVSWIGAFKAADAKAAHANEVGGTPT